jgi:uncharacterized protein YdeI (YjbR/CyaY-like superfamily)
LQSGKPVYFATPADFRAWFEKNHARESELWVGFHKKATSTPSITWPESVDEALCFGWIDGVRKRIDDERYMIRFTPRKATSNWSNVNIKRVAELQALGLMKPEGLRVFEARDPKREYSYEQTRTVSLDAALEKKFRAKKKAWAFFVAQPPGYQRTLSFWVMSAKREETRLARLEKLIATSAGGNRIT